MIVAIRPKAPSKPVFEVATTRQRPTGERKRLANVGDGEPSGQLRVDAYGRGDDLRHAIDAGHVVPAGKQMPNVSGLCYATRIQPPGRTRDQLLEPFDQVQV